MLCGLNWFPMILKQMSFLRFRLSIQILWRESWVWTHTLDHNNIETDFKKMATRKKFAIKKAAIFAES